ncbi:hypothetical protein Hanom_Chr16g01484961 [Helianthus anomalus]|nr:hypothetical protein HanIR_Chr10g0493561 [Helianthus annuus]
MRFGVELKVVSPLSIPHNLRNFAVLLQTFVTEFVYVLKSLVYLRKCVTHIRSHRHRRRLGFFRPAFSSGRSW